MLFILIGLSRTSAFANMGTRIPTRPSALRCHVPRVSQESSLRRNRSYICLLLLYSFSATETGTVLLHVLTNYFNVPLSNSNVEILRLEKPPSIQWFGESGKFPCYLELRGYRPWFYKISNSPTPFLSTWKYLGNFPLPLGRESNPSPCIPQYIPLIVPGSYPWGKPMTCALLLVQIVRSALVHAGEGIWLICKLSVVSPGNLCKSRVA